MTDILVRPPEMRDRANQMRQSAKTILNAVQQVESIMKALGPSRFEGVRAANLMSRYNRTRDKLFNFKPFIDKFGNELDVAAGRFESADKSGSLGEL